MPKMMLIIKNFIISILTAYFVTNNENYVYIFLVFIGVKDEVLKKSILGAVIVLLYGFISMILEVVFRSVCILFSKIKIEISIKQNNKKKSSLVFSPNDEGLYEKQEVELEVKMNPKGKFSNYIAKYLDINLEVFFNPELIDVELAKQWENQSLNGFSVNSRSIRIHILKKMNTKGEQFNLMEYKMIEKILFQPVSIMKTETYLDYCPSLGEGNFLANKLAKHFVEVTYRQFKIICEEER